MKICIITEYFPYSLDFEIKGGVEACAFNESNALSNNHEIIVLTSKEENMPDNYKINDINVFCCGNERSYVQGGSFLNRLSFMKSAINIGKTFNPDIIIGYNFITYPVAWKIAKKIKKPVIARYHDVWIGSWVKNMGITGLFGELLERYVLSRNWDMIIPVSDYTKNNLKKYFSEDKIHTVPNIVDFKQVTSEKYPETTISCVARLVEYKKVDDLIRAIKILKENNHNVKCKIVGSGPLEKKLKSLTKNLDLEDYVEFLGFVEKHDDVLKVINSSQIFCLPSIVEGFGIVVIEAMSCKVPFVAAKIPPVMEASNQKGGLFFEPENSEDLADKIIYLLNNSETYKKLQTEGWEQSQKYSSEYIGIQLEELFKKVMKK